MKNPLSSRTLYVLLDILLITTFFGCQFRDVGSNVTEVPTDFPLSEFIIGSWSTEQVYLPSGEEENYLGFDVTFRDEGTVEVVVKENGDPMYITISEYQYKDSDTIFVDNKRLRGGEIWHLERDAQKLIVQIVINGDEESLRYVLVRNP